MASLVLGAAGAAVGFMVGGPAGAQLGFALGSAAGGLLFPPKGPDGPRLNDLSVHTSSYGQAIPIPYGTDRVAGNVIWADKIQEHANEQGGKGGPEYTTYSYTCSLAVGIVAGPIAGILRIWADGLLIYDRRPTNTGEAVGFKAGSYKIYLGTETQLPDPTIQAITGDTPAYRGLAYIVFTDLELGKFGNRIPSLTFEYVTNGSDAIPQATTFGEAYHSGGLTFNGDIDSNGHVWVNTMHGYAVYDSAAGEYVIDPNTLPKPQIQEYDGATHMLLWAYDVPPIAEEWSPGQFTQIYPMQGIGVYSNGYFYVGRGSPGWPAGSQDAQSFVHGMAVNAETHAISYMVDTCSHGQFNNAMYWPTIPIPVIDNNKVYFASSNGVMNDIAVGFMPASIQGSPDTDPIPDRSGADALWSLPVGWVQARPKNAACPLNHEFDGVALHLPDWAYKSTVVENPSAVVVQGRVNTGGSYLAWIAHSPMVTGFDLSAPSESGHVILPGSSTIMPPVAWDAANGVLWAFAGDGSYGTLFSITPSVGGPLLEYSGFSFPAITGVTGGDNVVGMTIDKTTGYLRVIVGGGNDTQYPARLVLLDPINQNIIEDMPISTSIRGGVQGRLMDFPEQGKVVFANGYNIIDIPYGAPLNANPANLGAIVANLSRRVGLTLDDIDVSELTDMVDGYTITHQMAARSAIEPLMQAYFFDPVESDYKIKFRKRGRPASATIPDEELAAHSSGSEAPDLIEIRRKQELDLPQCVNVKYKSIAADYQTGTQYERRMTGRSQSDVTVDIPVAMSDEKAKQIAAAALYSAWAERTGLTFATSLKYAALEPTDMAIVHNRLVRIVHKKRNGGILEWEAYADGNTIYPSETISQGGAAAPSGQVGQVITTTPPTQLIPIDAPITQEGTTTPSITFAVQGTATGFAGAQIWKSIDGGVSYQPVASAPNASLIGTAQNALGTYSGGDTFDEINTLTVSLLPSSTGATLSSATELAVLNGANAALVGDEVLQYKRAVLNDDGTYTLSGLLRYRRGTDYATHVAGESFVPLTSSLVQIPVSTAEIGLPRQYKAVSNGGTLSSAQPVTLTYTGADLKPYSPVHIGGWRDADGNVTATWVRRTRVGGEWRDGVDVPLSEATEAYDVEILSGPGGSVVRTISGVTAPTLVYSAADQVADFGALQSMLLIRVFQLSQIVGRGFPGIGVI